MRTFRQAAALLLAALLAGDAAAQSPASQPQQPSITQTDLKRARKAAELGDKAEAAGHFDEALGAYTEAARYAPQDPRIVEKFVILRSRVVQNHVEAAERAALANQFDEATQELAAALAIDPLNKTILERLGQIKGMEERPAAKPSMEIEGLPKLLPKPGKQNLDLRGDTKTVYQQLASLFGVRAAFDPDLSVRNVRVRVDNLDFKTAMSVVGAQTATFWRPLTADQFLVAGDTAEKRREYNLQAVQTFPLSAAVGPEDATEVLRIVRDITGGTRIDLDTRSHTITMRDTPEKLAVAGALIDQLERARGEVMLEIELLEVDRTTARNLGVTAPTSARLFTIPPSLITQLQQATNLSAIQSLLAGIFGGAGAAAGSISSLIPPLVAIGGGKSTFLLTLPGTALNFSEGLSLVRTGQQVLLRAQDGKPATFFVGDRYPITLSLLSNSLGNSGFTPSVGGASNPFPSTSYAAGKGPVALVAADFLNNGLPDFAAINNIDNTVTVLLNQNAQQGTFAAATGSPLTVGAARAAAPLTPPGIASAIFTTSGCHDLVAGDPLASTLQLFLSNCDGTFKTPVAIPTGSNPTAIVTGDFNGDGNQDIAVANENDDSISVFLGDGTGKFIPAAGSPFLLSKQLAVTSTSLPDGLLSTAYSATLQSIGGLGPTTWSIASGTLPAGLTLTAATGIISGIPTAAGISNVTFKVTDSSNPPVSTAIPLSISINAAAPAISITTTSLANGSLGTPYDQLLTATGGAAPLTWTVSSGALPAGLSLNAVTGEITGTPTSTATPVPSSTFTIAVTDSSGVPVTVQKQFTLTPLSGAELGPVAMVVGDFNADGKPDLAIVNQSTNNVTIFLGNGDGTFAPSAASPLTVGKLPVALATGDLSGNARADLAVVNQTDATVSILLNNGDGTFSVGPNSPLSTPSTPTAITIADFNQDGHNDFAVTSEGANTFSVFAGVAAGLFALAFEPPAGPTGTFPTGIVSGTFGAGGFPDVAITNNISGSDGDVTVVFSPANLFSSVGSTGALQQPYPGSEYVDLGVKIKATPTHHPNKEVTLQLEFEIRALAGSSVNGIPIISNRTLSQTVRVKEDEPTLIGGLTDVEETRTITGLPGFAKIPGLGYAFGTRSNALSDTELIIMVTPHTLRLADHLTRTIFAGRGDTGGPRTSVAPINRDIQPQPPQPVPQQPVPQQPQPLPPQPQQQPPQPQSQE